MNWLTLSKLVREAAINNRLENIDPESENLEAQVERAAMYLPVDAKLGDERLSFLSFSVEASAFNGMPEEEINKFIVEQFPEHKWGGVAHREENGLLRVRMNEAKARITTLIRTCAAIVFYGKPKKKQFILSVELDADEVLPFMNENDFIQLVIHQFPQHNWYDTHCDQKDGVITVTLFSSGTKGKSPKCLGAKSISLIKDTYMIAMPLESNGVKKPIPVLSKDFCASLEASGVTVFLHPQLAKLFGEDNVLKFIAEQFPTYRLHLQTKFIDEAVFLVTLVEKE